MLPRHTLPALIVLTSFACVIDPGVLEGGDEAAPETDTESGETDSSTDTDSGTDTGESDLAECIRGTNPQGGADPGDFPLGACTAFVCDDGWGHGGPPLPIAWTVKFAKSESQQGYTAVGVVPRSEGDGVLVIARRDDGPELSTVSAQGELLASTMLPTSLKITSIEAGDGMIYLVGFEEQPWGHSVLAITETGELLWSVPVEGLPSGIAARPEGGVVATLANQEDNSKLTALSPTGSVDWTVPSILPEGFAVSPAGRILIMGTTEGGPSARPMAIYGSDGTLLEQTTAPPLSLVGSLQFVDEQRVLHSAFVEEGQTVGGPYDGVVQLLELDAGTNTWSHQYNRALAACNDLDTQMPTGNTTSEFFGPIVRLDDGTFLIAAAEEGEIQSMMQPRVLHIDAAGQLLASDRGLWSGQSKALAAGDDGSGYALLTIGDFYEDQDSNDGFYLRKYQVR